MPRSLKIYIAGVVTVGAGALAVTTLFFAPNPEIAINPSAGAILGIPADAWNGQFDIWLGIAFWTALTLWASAMPVKVPRGSHVAVAIAPVLAAMSLGGPFVAGLVAAFGSTEVREIRGRIPWYGTLANHAAIVIPATVGSIVMLPFPRHDGWGLVAVVVGAAVYTALNVSLASILLSLRTRQSFRSVLMGNAREFSIGQLALAPLAWLMAQIYLATAWWAALLFALPLYTTRLAFHRFVEMREMFTQTISSLAQAVDKRDPYTSGHSRRVMQISVDIGREMRVSDTELEALEWGGLLHDVGKIGVSDAVLMKAERLTKEERMLMNLHPVLGAEIIAPVTKLAPELPIIRHHHEWYNGSGYPDRLMGDEIPKLARVLHVADAFEAMTAARPYRMKPLSAEQALGELRKFAGIQFDPAVVDAFVRTKWVEGVPDSGRDVTPRPVPLISQAAGRVAQAAVLTDSSGITPELH